MGDAILIKHNNRFDRHVLGGEPSVLTGRFTAQVVATADLFWRE